MQRLQRIDAVFAELSLRCWFAVKAPVGRLGRGVGIMGASAIAATVIDPMLFRSGRQFAAWLGMTSSGRKERLGRTSKRGDKYIRCLLVAGAVAVLRHTRNRTTKDAAWVRGLLARRHLNLAHRLGYHFRTLKLDCRMRTRSSKILVELEADIEDHLGQLEGVMHLSSGLRHA